MKVLTIDENGNECWTNPPTSNISEVWEFIERVFKGKHIKAFKFYGENKLYLNPKEKFIQLELF